MQFATEPKPEDVASGWITNGTCPADSLGRSIGKKHVVVIFPNEFSGFGVDAYQAFAFLCRFRFVAGSFTAEAMNKMRLILKN